MYPKKVAETAKKSMDTTDDAERLIRDNARSVATIQKEVSTRAGREGIVRRYQKLLRIKETIPVNERYQTQLGPMHPVYAADEEMIEFSKLYPSLFYIATRRVEPLRVEDLNKMLDHIHQMNADVITEAECQRRVLENASQHCKTLTK